MLKISIISSENRTERMLFFAILASCELAEVIKDEPAQHVAEAADQGPLEPVPESHDLPPVLVPGVTQKPPHRIENLKLAHFMYCSASAESLVILYCCTSRSYFGFGEVGRVAIMCWKS